MEIFKEKNGNHHILIRILKRSLSLSMENRSEEAVVSLSGWPAFFFFKHSEIMCLIEVWTTAQEASQLESRTIEKGDPTLMTVNSITLSRKGWN